MTGGDPVWAELWDRLKIFFGTLVDQLRECNQHLGSLPGHQQTRAFPFTGYVSLGRTAPSFDEDLVLTWSIAWREGHLIGSADIVRGDGMILAENVPAELPDPVGRNRLFAEQDRAMRFFLDNLDLIKREVMWDDTDYSQHSGLFAAFIVPMGNVDEAAGSAAAPCRSLPRDCGGDS